MSEKTDWEYIQDAIDKSETDFEQKLTYITAGTLVLSLTFIEKIVNISDTSGVIFLIVGWIFLVLTLIINLISHLTSKYFLKVSQNEISKNVPLDERIKTINRNNRKIDRLNILTVVLLILGIISIIVFASINSYNKTKKTSSANSEFKISVPTDLINKNDSIISINFNMSKKQQISNPQPREVVNEGVTIPNPQPSPDIVERGRTVPTPRVEPTTPKPEKKD